MTKSLFQYHGHTVERLLPRSTPIRHHQSLLDTIGHDRMVLHHDSGYFVFNPPLPADTPHHASLAITQPFNQPEQPSTQSEAKVNTTKLSSIQDTLALAYLKANDYFDSLYDETPEVNQLIQLNDSGSELRFVSDVLNTLTDLIARIDNQIGVLPEPEDYYEPDTIYY